MISKEFLIFAVILLSQNTLAASNEFDYNGFFGENTEADIDYTILTSNYSIKQVTNPSSVRSVELTEYWESPEVNFESILNFYFNFQRHKLIQRFVT